MDTDKRVLKTWGRGWGQAGGGQRGAKGNVRNTFNNRELLILFFKSSFSMVNTHLVRFAEITNCCVVSTPHLGRGLTFRVSLSFHVVLSVLDILVGILSEQSWHWLQKKTRHRAGHPGR